MTTYRLDRAPALAVAGVLVIVAALTGFVTALMSSVALGIVTAALLVIAIVVVARPPVVLRLDAERIRTRRSSAAWKDVQDVRHGDGQLMLSLGPEGAAQRVLRIALATVGTRAPELVREVYDRLNTAHGYRRFDA